MVSLTSILGVLRDLVMYTYNCLVFLLYTLTTWVVTRRTKNSQGYMKEYESSAQIRKIIWKRKLFSIDVVSTTDFITSLESVAHPEYVLRPNVSLYDVTEKEALFVETPVGLNIYKSDLSPFLYIAQFKHCTKVITMPIESLHRLADSLGDPKVPVIWMSNTGRCGSTALGQVFERLPGTVLLGEPDLTNLGYLRRGNVITQEEYENMLVSMVRILCKPHPGANRFVVKTRSCGVVLMKGISERLPTIKQLFVYRNGLPTISSFLALLLTESAPIISRYFIDSDLLSFFCPFFRNRLRYYYAVDKGEMMEDPCKMNTVEAFTNAWANCMVLAKEAKDSDKTILPIKYEDIKENALEACRKIFSALEIDLAEAENAAEALKKDSQRGSVLSQSSVGKDPRREINSSDWRKANVILKRHGLPLLGEETRL